MLGIFAASLTAFNLIRKVATIDLSTFFTDVLATYQNWIHLPVLWILAWMHLPLPPAWAIDLGLLWVLLGGVVLRTAWSLRASILAATDFDKKVTHTGFGYFDWLLSHRWNLPVFLLVTVLAWPAIALTMIAAPHVTKEERFGDGPDVAHFELIKAGSKPSSTMGYNGYLFDLRIVLATQTAAAIICLIAWIGTNVLLKLFGE